MHLTFTVPEGLEGVIPRVYSNYTSTALISTAVFSEIMLVSGTYTAAEMPEYEAYGVSPSMSYPSEPQFTGELVEEGTNAGKYAVPFTVRGKNLIPYPYASSGGTVNGVSLTVCSDGRLILNGVANGNRTFYLYNANEMKMSGAYTLSLNLEGGEATGEYYAQPMIDNDWEQAATAVMTRTYQWDGILTKLPFFIRSGASFKNAVISIQLEEGTRATGYEPYYSETKTMYLDNPLCGFGAVHDCIDFANYIDYDTGEELVSHALIRNVGKIVLDGTESIAASTSINGFTIDCLPFAMTMADGLCNYYSVVTSDEMPVPLNGGNCIFLGFTNDTKVHFPYNAFYDTDVTGSGAAAFANWLATLYEEGKPVTIYYPLGSEQEISGMTLSTFELPDRGTVIAEGDCTVKPDAEVMYYTDANKRIAALEAAVIALGGTI